MQKKTLTMLWLRGCVIENYVFRRKVHDIFDVKGHGVVRSDANIPIVPSFGGGGHMLHHLHKIGRLIVLR